MNWGVTSWSLSRVELRSREWKSVEVSDFPEANPLQLEVLNVSSVSCPKTPRFCPREYLDNLPLRLYFVESYKVVCLFSERMVFSHAVPFHPNLYCFLYLQWPQVIPPILMISLWNPLDWSSHASLPFSSEKLFFSRWTQRKVIPSS